MPLSCEDIGHPATTQLNATLGEGNTPLVPSIRLGGRYGLRNLWFKLESCNPSGSYKDRFVAGEVTRILRLGMRACLATSSGNTGSALASFCARYGLRCLILVNESAPAGKLMQMQAHGALVVRVPGFVTDPEITTSVFATLESISAESRIPIVISAYRYCPEGMSRVEAIAGEILQRFPGRAPHIFVPVGGGGLCAAVLKGAAGSAARVHAVQPEGCPTLVRAFAEGRDHAEPVVSSTRISGLSVPTDIDATLALRLLRQSGGDCLAISDDEAFAAQQQLLAFEGIYCEPAAATALAGACKAVAAGALDGDDPVVCLVTGHGFKDADAIASVAARQPARRAEASGLRHMLEAELDHAESR